MTKSEQIRELAKLIKNAAVLYVKDCMKSVNIGEERRYTGRAECQAEQIYENGYSKVVRCKDCKHLMFSDIYGECCKNYLSGVVTPDSFCSRGERR